MGGPEPMAWPEAQVLIVSRACPFTDGMRALPATIPAMDSIAQMDDAAAVLAFVAHRTAVVVLDVGLQDEQGQAVVRQIRAASPQTRCLVLADSVQQQP